MSQPPAAGLVEQAGQMHAGSVCHHVLRNAIVLCGKGQHDCYLVNV